MRKLSASSFFCLLLLLAALSAPRGFAQCVSLTTPGSAYTQNFDTLSNVAGSTTNTLTIPGWFMTEGGGGARDNEQYAVDTGSSTTGDTYSYGAAGSTERALGALRSGTLVPNFGACFTNNTGTAISSLTVAYTGEQWRLGTAGRTDQINFEFSTNATDLATGTWTGVSALNFISPDTATVGAKNGNAAADRTALSNSFSINVPNGATFWIRWTDIDASGADDGLAVDDFSLTPQSGSLSTNPSGSGSSNPSSVNAGSSTTLTANITPGTNDASTGIAVSCNLAAIGGSSTFNLPNTTGNTYSAGYTVPAGTAEQSYTLPCTVTDAQGRSGNFNIGLVVTSPVPTNPSGVGTANPNSLQAGASTLLTVTVAAGTNPVSSGIGVIADLSQIGGAASQQFFNDGTNGDVTANDSIFSFNATVLSGTATGAKSLPVTISDAQSRNGSTSIALTVQAPPPTTLKISQVYGGGGNSGATFSADFIELFNQSTTPIDVSTWSVQKASAGVSTWEITNLCANGATCVIQPGHYYLVQEATTVNANSVPLPTADITGIIAMGAGSGKIALVANTTLLTGACPTGGAIVDFLGYGGTSGTPPVPVPSCFEGVAGAALSNTTAAIRKNNGCIDTNNNAADFVVGGPIPRNSGSPVNFCGGDATQPSGVGTASPTAVDPAGSVLLTVAVTPASTPFSTGITVTGNLTSIGGGTSQLFYDDGTHGDLTAGDNVFSFRANTLATAAYGAYSMVTTITDSQGRSATAPITFSVQSPTCGVERWAVKTGTDAGAGSVDLLHPIRTTIKALRAIPAPALNENPPYDPRMSPTETSVFVVNGTMTFYKLETDVDYHIVLQDQSGNTMVTEIPSPACDGSTSPFDAAVTAVRDKFDDHFTATPTFQLANVPVQMKGVGFFDFIHGQTGVAPNGIELHPILDISFTAGGTIALSSTANPGVFGQPVTITATISSAGGAATGDVSFFEGATLLGTGTLDGTGKASLTISSLSAGAHSITASYEGDSSVAQATSAIFTQNIGQATPVITWASPADLAFGSPLSATQLNATASVPGTFVYTPAAGAVLAAGNGQTLSVVFNPTSGNYSSASKSVGINVLPPAGPATLLMTQTLVRDGGTNEVVVTLTLANTGGTAATGVQVTSAKIGAIGTTTPLPAAMPVVPAGGASSVVLRFPGAVGAAGTRPVLSVSAVYSGGAFTGSSRVTLP